MRGVQRPVLLASWGRTSETTVSDLDGRTRYGGRWFSAATALPLGGGLTHPWRLASLLAVAALRPRRLAALIRILVRTRTESVFLTGSSAGQALRTYFNQRWLGVFPKNRFCRGVLVIPQHHSEYLRGRRRQALRTNLRGAAIAGIRCEEISDRTSALEEVSDRRRANIDCRVAMRAQEALLTGPETTIMVARDERGTPLAFMETVIDDMVCLIRMAVASSHHARWALHDHLVRTLVDRGVRYLLADGGGTFGALGYATGVHHYQHLLGYELRHIIPSADARPVGSRPNESILGSGYPDAAVNTGQFGRSGSMPTAAATRGNTTSEADLLEPALQKAPLRGSHGSTPA